MEDVWSTVPNPDSLKQMTRGVTFFFQFAFRFPQRWPVFEEMFICFELFQFNVFWVWEFSFPVMLEENKISFNMLLWQYLCIYVWDSQLVVKSIGEGVFAVARCPDRPGIANAGVHESWCESCAHPPPPCTGSMCMQKVEADVTGRHMQAALRK